MPSLLLSSLPYYFFRSSLLVVGVTWLVVGGVASTEEAGAVVLECQAAGAVSVPCKSNPDGTLVVSSGAPASITPITLDVKTVTTGGTAVVALVAGHKTAGGWLQNPVGATINLCINELGTAVGTTSSGDTTCIVPGQTYTLTPSAGAVSVISSDSSHPFSGVGYQ